MKSQNVLRPGQNQLIFLNHLKEYNIYYPNTSSPQLNVVSEVQATKMARTAHANAITSPQLGGVGVGGGLVSEFL